MSDRWSRALTVSAFLAFMAFQIWQWAAVERVVEKQTRGNEAVGKLMIEAMEKQSKITERSVDKLIDAFRKEQRLIRDHDRKMNKTRLVLE